MKIEEKKKKLILQLHYTYKILTALFLHFLAYVQDFQNIKQKILFTVEYGILFLKFNIKFDSQFLQCHHDTLMDNSLIYVLDELLVRKKKCHTHTKKTQHDPFYTCGVLTSCSKKNKIK